MKVAELLAMPFAVTATCVAPAAMFGTVATICGVLHEMTVAKVVPKRTVPVPCVAPKDCR